MRIAVASGKGGTGKTTVSVNLFHFLSNYFIINKYDMNLVMTARTEQFFEGKNVPVLGKIPFDTRLVSSMTLAMSIIEYAPQNKISIEIRDIWNKFLQFTGKQKLIYAT